MHLYGFPSIIVWITVHNCGGGGGGGGGGGLAFLARATSTLEVNPPGRRNSKFRGV